MKRAFVIWLLAVTAACVSVGCKKASTPIPQGMQLRVNNVLWTPLVDSALTYPIAYVSDVDNLILEGSDSGARHIFILINHPIKQGTYKLDGYYGSTYATYNGIDIEQGVVNITKVTTDNVQGTFTLNSSVTITGQFNLPLQR